MQNFFIDTLWNRQTARRYTGCMSDALSQKPTLKRLQALMAVREQIENMPSSARPWNPAVDWIENDAHLILMVDLPGVEDSTLRLEADPGGLHLSGERPFQHLGKPLQQERPNGSFSRYLEFPIEVLPQTHEVKFQQGVLTIVWEKLGRIIDVETTTTEP